MIARDFPLSFEGEGKFLLFKFLSTYSAVPSYKVGMALFAQRFGLNCSNNGGVRLTKWTGWIYI